MFRTFFHAGRSVRVLAVRILLPRVLDWIVPLHRWAFLLANPVVVKVSASQAIRLLRSRAATGTEQMAALSRLGPETPSLMALRTAVDFRELLAIVRSFTPASSFAGLVARGTISFRFMETVNVQVFGSWTGDYLIPLNRLDVAQVVIVENANASR